jgi:hypothetical protein
MEKNDVVTTEFEKALAEIKIAAMRARDLAERLSGSDGDAKRRLARLLNTLLDQARKVGDALGGP